MAEGEGRNGRWHCFLSGTTMMLIASVLPNAAPTLRVIKGLAPWPDSAGVVIQPQTCWQVRGLGFHGSPSFLNLRYLVVSSLLSRPPELSVSSSSSTQL